MGGGASHHATAKRERLVGISRKPRQASRQGHGSSSSESKVEGTCPDSILGRIEEWLRDDEIDLGDLGLVRIEAEAALELIVEASYQLAADDEKLAPFFEGINMDLVHTHQVQFLRAALSAGQFSYPDRPIRLARLFRGGLDETHFDLFLGHVVTALREFLPEELVAETVQTVLPLRTFFQQEGLRHRGSNQGEGAKRIARRAGQ
ncbi:hypothetical protein B484DRAFT_450695 [Ochromonadaceae sp. CCMP2298]|nr:hypothetical protein B484DRAFT_450695 [Ochromonadaceae sp. CCMP2298]